MKREAKWNSKRNTGTYSHCIHYSELIKGANIVGDGSPATEQNLSDRRGLDGAKKLLLSRYKINQP